MAQESTELIGEQKIRNDLRMLMDRLLSPAEVLEVEFAVLEEAEDALFQAHAGRYVETGALRASLTQSEAKDAIRRIIPAGAIPGIEFGTAIWYAKFQRNIGGPSGKPRGRKRVGPNQVLKLTPEARRNAVATVREYLFEMLGPHA